VPVVRGPVAVNGNADTDAMLVEKLAEVLVKQDAIGMYLYVEAAQVAKRALEFNEDRAQPGHSGKERLAAVQHYLNVVKFVGLDMLGDAHRRLRYNIGRHAHGTAAPTLVNALVDVAVVACQVAPAVHLEYELIRRDEHAAVHARVLPPR
jgi:hypothetical protein